MEDMKWYDGANWWRCATSTPAGSRSGPSSRSAGLTSPSRPFRGTLSVFLMGRRPICKSKSVPNPRPSLYFLGFFEDNDERGLRFAEHGRLASFGVQCGCLGAYDRPSFLRWTPRAGMSMYVRVAGKLCGIGRVTMGHKGRAFMYGDG